MYLCQAKHKRLKCKHAERNIDTIEDNVQLENMQEFMKREFKNRKCTYKVGDDIIDYNCYQEYDKPWNKCKCMRAHAKEV